MHYDVIIIGAGSMGMAAGYQLSKRGKRTLLLDALNPPHDKGSHHGETRIIRHAYGEGEEYVPFALASQRLWLELEKLTGKQIFLETGVINVGKRQSTFIQNIISSAKHYALPLEVLDANEVQARFPGIALQEGEVACFEPTSGVLKCEECMDAYKMLAIKHGAKIKTNSKVENIIAKEKQVTVQTMDQTFHADAIVVCAGAWSQSLLSLLNINIPLQPIRKTFAWYHAEEATFGKDTFPAFSFEAPNGTYYGFPSIDGAGVKIGRHDGGEQIYPSDSMQPFQESDAADLGQFLHTYMPQVDTLKYGKTCKYTMTPDEHFVIDLHPNHPNIAIAAGFSGHGFKFSSAVGEVLGDLIIDGTTSHHIAPFSLNRFASQTLL